MRQIQPRKSAGGELQLSAKTVSTFACFVSCLLLTRIVTIHPAWLNLLVFVKYSASYRHILFVGVQSIPCHI